MSGRVIRKNKTAPAVPMLSKAAFLAAYTMWYYFTSMFCVVVALRFTTTTTTTKATTITSGIGAPPFTMASKKDGRFRLIFNGEMSRLLQVVFLFNIHMHLIYVVRTLVATCLCMLFTSNA